MSADYTPTIGVEFFVWQNEVKVSRRGTRSGCNVTIKVGEDHEVTLFITSPEAEAQFFDAIAAARPSLEALAAEAAA